MSPKVPKLSKKKVSNLKKTISILGIIITFFILYFLQIDLFNWFNIAGIKPNLFIVLVLCLGLFIGRKYAAPIGFIIGIYLDVLAGSQIGISALMYAAIGFLGGYFDKNFSKDSKITILLMVAGSTLLYETVVYIYTIARNAIPLEFWGFIKIVLIETLFNVLLTIILYPLIRKTGYFFEETFKQKKFLTRYF
ncbi:MAG: rod shape-determining protein MreD [Clostridia bacterium]|nr:rod shape-determining protein MreD [Clostridia bacterium]